MNSDLTCVNCVFFEVCSESLTRCDDFADINSDTYLDSYIEEKRAEFLEEWFDYISEWEA